LQGSVIEHMQMLSQIDNVTAVEVKDIESLNSIDGLILPGGESTTIGKLLKDFNLFDPLLERINNKMPVWGTCAGMILLARKISNEDYNHLGVMDMSVTRNAYGAQLDSFTTYASIPEVSDDKIPLVFIRAPWVDNVGDKAQIIATVDDRIAAVRQDNMLATSFHPELTTDLSFHKYFVGFCE